MEDWKEWAISWPAIIIMLIAFWPIGLMLLYFRGICKSGKLKTNGILLVIIAIICYFMGFTCLSITFEDLSKDLGVNIFVDILFFGGAIAVTVYAFKNLMKYKCYKKYIEKIGARKKVSIDELAQQIGDTTEEVIANVSNAIKYKMLNGYINEKEEIIIKSSNMQDNVNIYKEEKEEIVTVQCKNCGANNKFVVGKENRCEFCNSILEKQYIRN